MTSMAAMFVVVGGVRWRERRSALRAGGGPSTAVVGSPPETYQELVDKSEYLRDQHWTKTFHAAFMGGAYVGMAGLLSLVLGGNMASQFITQKAVFAALFPINLFHWQQCHHGYRNLREEVHREGFDSQLEHCLHWKHLRMLVD